MTKKEQKFQKITEDWSVGDSILLFILHLCLIIFIYGTIFKNSILVIFVVIFMFLVMIGWFVFIERKVYWRRIK